MKRALMLMLLVLCGGAAPATRAPAAGGTRFAAVQVFIDPKGRPLAAWQVEFAAEVGRVSLVGVEAGEKGAYGQRPAFYDPAALAGNRIVIGDYSLAADVPKGKARVATLMLEIRGDGEPQYVTKLIAAADPEGRAISADVSVK
jgi:hypothetical protein